MRERALPPERGRGSQCACAMLLLASVATLVCLVLPIWNRPDLAAQGADRFVWEGETPPPREVWTRLRYVSGFARARGELCPARGAHTPLVILVTSAPANAAEREAVRSTWALAARRANVTLAFILASPPPQLREAIDDEDARFEDLIEARFVDSYANLSLKTIAMLEWFVTYCPLAPRFFKTDDDMFINIEQLLSFAEEHNGTNTIWSEALEDIEPTRDKRFKYYVPESEYPESRYPPFPVGHGYLISGDAVPVLSRAALDARFVRLEDVFLGVVASRAGVRCVNAPELLLTQDDTPCGVRSSIVIASRYHEQFNRWAKLWDPDTACPPVTQVFD